MKTLKEIMTKKVVCVNPTDTLQEVAMRMKELDAGSLPVCDNDRLTGMVTDRDIVVKAVADGRDTRTITASDVMKSPAVYCFENQSVDEAIRVMEQEKIRRLLVLDDNKKLVGIVSLGDLTLRGGSEDLAYELLASVSEPRSSAAA